MSTLRDQIAQLTTEANAVLDPAVIRTPLLPYRDGIFLKAENLQRTGSFKFRGAYYSIATLTPQQREARAIAYSTGNHAQAVALAGSMLGVKTTVVMSESAPPEKIANTKRFGATVIMAENSSFARKQLAEQLAAEHGYGLIPPYEDVKVMAAQGTIALEILATQPDVQTMIIPVGGGGLIAGIAIAAKSIKPSIRVIGVEPAGAADAHQSYVSKALTKWDTITTICDGLSVQQLGATNFDLIQQVVDDIVLVDDALTQQAMRTLLVDHRLLVEASGAITVAALDHGLIKGNQPMVAVLSGGNIAPSKIIETLTSAARA
jgi:threonine dehydratase